MLKATICQKWLVVYKKIKTPTEIKPFSLDLKLNLLLQQDFCKILVRDFQNGLYYFRDATCIACLVDVQWQQPFARLRWLLKRGGWSQRVDDSLKHQTPVGLASYNKPGPHQVFEGLEDQNVGREFSGFLYHLKRLFSSQQARHV